MSNQVNNLLYTFESDHVWISQNLEKLQEKYNDQWIAVQDGKVIASAPDFDELVSKLHDPAYTCVEFITREPMEMIL